MKLKPETKTEPQQLMHVEFLSDVDDPTAEPPTEDLLTLGHHDPRAMIFARWTSTCLTLVLGFGLGRVPADFLISSPTHQRAAPAVVSHRAASHPTVRRAADWNVIGTNSRGAIGSYDKHGHWHPYRGYVTPTEVENLTHVSRPGHRAT